MELNFKKKDVDIEGAEVKEVDCKSALSESGLESDYALNPYRGCYHGCRYCYAPFVIKDDREWGSFVEVRRNMPKVLAEELNKKEKGVVRLGSVTDPYQKVEKEYKVTRLCLKQLKKKEFPIIIQTKSGLITRDIDILEDMDADVGFTITSLDEDFKDKYEPNAPPIEERFDAMKELVESGIPTWVFIGPLMPYQNDDPEALQKIAERIDSIGVDEVYLDKLNMRKGIWPKLEELLDDELLEKYEDIFFGDEDYFEDHRDLYKKIGRPVF